jgi:hypothetical protein
MATEMALAQRIAAEIRAEMAWQSRGIPALAKTLELGLRATQRRYNGEVEFGLDEIDAVCEWLGVSKRQITTGERDRELGVTA